jgi:acetyl-CoA acetyltransferase
MGVGPTVAVPKLLSRYNLTVDDIDLWELNEAFAVVPLHCADVLGIDHEKMNVNGGKAYMLSLFFLCYRINNRIFATLSDR